MMRRLIVNADDFGETAAVTQGILDCFRAGTVRSTSVVVNTDFWPEARAIIRDTQGLDYGLHLNLTSGRPCTSVRNLRPLLEPDGTFPARTKMIGRILRHPECVLAIEPELSEQARRLAETGVPLTHINFHEHLFFLPPLWKLCLTIKDRFSIPFVRRPYQVRSVRPLLAGQSLKRLFLNFWFRDRQVAGTFDVNYVDSLGTAPLEEVYPAILHNCSSLTELVVHPGLAEATRTGSFDRARVREHAYLVTSALQALARDEGIELIGYRDLSTQADE